MPDASVIARRLRALFAALLLAGCATTASAQSVVTIDAILPLTGSNAFSGSLEAEALRIYERFANAHGGIRGQPIRFDVHDDESSPQHAVALLAQVAAGHPPVVIGGTPAQACGAMSPMVKDGGPVLYCTTPAATPAANGYVFATSMSLAEFDRGLIRYMRLRGWKRYAVISANDTTGQVADEATRGIFALPENRELQVVSWEHFNVTDLSIAAQISHIAAANPQAIIVWVSGTAFGTVLRSLHDAGIDLPLLTGGANVNAAQLSQYEGFLPRDMVLPGFPYMVPRLLQSTPLRRPVDDLIAAYAAAGAKIAPSGPGYAWDAADIVVGGLRKLGPGATAAQLRGYILGLRGYPGIDGLYNFSSGDQHGLTGENVLVVRFDPKDQRWVPASRLGGTPLDR
jgi:branched-chain amino acid transport system substrate-binding protein